MNKRMLIKLTIFFLLFLGATIGFVALADEVHEGETLAVDQTILRTINEHSSPALDQFFLVVTNFGGTIAVVIITVLALAVLLAQKHYKHATIVAAAVGGAALINVLLKLIFERARPDLWEQFIVETSYSFPSGHAMISSVLAFAAIAVFWKTKWRLVVIIAAIVFTILIGFSRLYLGVHYPTDVIAGWFVSAAWALGVVAVVNGWVYQRRSKIAKIE